MTAAAINPLQGATSVNPTMVQGPSPEELKARAAGLGRLMASLGSPDSHQQENQQQNQQFPVPVAKSPATATGPIVQQFR